MRRLALKIAVALFLMAPLQEALANCQLYLRRMNNSPVRKSVWIVGTNQYNQPQAACFNLYQDGTYINNYWWRGLTDLYFYDT